MKDRTVKLADDAYIRLWGIQNEYVMAGKKPPSMKKLLEMAVKDAYCICGTRPDDRSKCPDHYEIGTLITVTQEMSGDGMG